MRSSIDFAELARFIHRIRLEVLDLVANNRVYTGRYVGRVRQLRKRDFLDDSPSVLLQEPYLIKQPHYPVLRWELIQSFLG